MQKLKILKSFKELVPQTPGRWARLNFGPLDWENFRCFLKLVAYERSFGVDREVRLLHSLIPEASRDIERL